MTNYSEYRSNEITEINTATTIEIFAEQLAIQGVAQDDVNTITHNADSNFIRTVQVSELQPTVTGTSNTDLDFDLADEGQFIQENSVSGTDFIDGKVQLYSEISGPAGIDWELGSCPGGNAWTGVTYGNDLFVAVGYGSVGTRVMTSSDGISWTLRNTPEDNYWRAVTYGNGLFVSIAGDGTNRVMTSSDGINWTGRTASVVLDWQDIIYGNGLFVAVGDARSNSTIMTSTDGINWTSRTIQNYEWKAVTYGNGLFVAGARTGEISTSTDGITWTPRTSPSTYCSRATYGNGTYVIVGGGGQVTTSTDGITWTSRTAAAASDWLGITYADGLFVTVSYSTVKVMTSPDGINWTSRTTPTGSWKDVCYGNGKFVAVNGGGVMTSLPQSSYTTTQPYYVTTSNNNNINLSNIVKINSCSITNSQPAGTSIKGLVSFDGRSTWSTWSGSAWVDSAVTDIDTAEIGGIDTYYNQSLLIHSDTTNGSQVFTDSSANSVTITPSANINHSTTESKFGATSIYFDYVSNQDDRLQVPDSVLDVTGDFTIECWVKTYWNTASAQQHLLTKFKTVYTQEIELVFNAGNDLNTAVLGTVDFIFKDPSTGNGSFQWNVGNHKPYHNNNWTHLALVKSGNDLILFKNGVSKGTQTLTNPIPVWTDKPWIIGANEGSSGYSDSSMYMDEYRIVNSAVWTENFTPPDSPYSSQELDTVTGIGNSITDIQTGLSNITITDETSLDFVFDLVSEDPSVTPDIDQITFNYDEDGPYRVASGYDVNMISTTQTTVTKTSTGTEDIKVNVLI